MIQSLRTVIVNGSLDRPSRTRVLLDALRDRLNDNIALNVRQVDLVDLLPEISATFSRDAFSPELRGAIEDIENTDFLIIGTPVFRASFPGLFKHLFDLVDHNALNGKPVLLAATGGSARHALVIDHQLRPLFGFFQALTLPIGVYATPEDIQHERIVSDALRDRIALAADLANPVLHDVLRKLQMASVAAVVHKEAACLEARAA